MSQFIYFTPEEKARAQNTDFAEQKEQKNI